MSVQAALAFMQTFSEATLHDEIAAAGWHISHWENIRFATLRTAALWGERLTAHFGTTRPPGQLGDLAGMVQQVRRNPVAWAMTNPLILTVATAATHTAQSDHTEKSVS